MPSRQIPSLALAASILLPHAAYAAAPSALGKIDFPVTTKSEPARQQFLRGVLALHSFWYDEAYDAFKASVESDPSFAMGYWGEAMAKSKLLWRDDNLPAGREALAKIGALEG